MPACITCMRWTLLLTYVFGLHAGCIQGCACVGLMDLMDHLCRSACVGKVSACVVSERAQTCVVFTAHALETKHCIVGSVHANGHRLYAC